MTKKKSQKNSKEKKINALSSIVTWVGDPSHLNKPENSESEDEVLTDAELDAQEEAEYREESKARSASSNTENHSELEDEPEGSAAETDSESNGEFDSELEIEDELLLDSDSESELEIDDELVTDSDLKLDSEPTELELNDQLERISKLLHEQSEQIQNETLEYTPPTFDPEKELARQIAEDMALEASQAQAQLENEPGAETSNFLESALNFNTENKTDETPLDLAEIQSCIEALLFISDKPLSVVKLKELLAPELDRELFQDAVTGLCTKYQQVAHGIEIVEVGGGYQFRTKPGRASLAQKLAKVQTQRLSSGGMESLAIIAYRQPVMKEDIDKVRGVDSSYFIRGLLEKKLIKISGRSELPGRPVLYNTTQEFLELFGLRDLASLPSLRELEQMIPNSQSSNPEDEDPRIRTMRRLVGEMNVDGLGALKYDPKEDEKLLKEFRERITAIPSSTPYLDEMKAAELLAKQQLILQQQQEQAQATSPQPVNEE